MSCHEFGDFGEDSFGGIRIFFFWEFRYGGFRGGCLKQRKESRDSSFTCFSCLKTNIYLLRYTSTIILGMIQLLTDCKLIDTRIESAKAAQIYNLLNIYIYTCYVKRLNFLTGCRAARAGEIGEQDTKQDL